MATLTASAAQANQPAIMSVNRTTTRVVTYSASAALSAGDIMQMVKVPAGAVVSAIRYAASLSAGVVTVIIGDGNNKSAYAAATVLSAAAIAIADSTVFAGLGRSYSAEDTIDIEVTAVSAAPGTAKIKLAVEYSNQN